MFVCTDELQQKEPATALQAIELYGVLPMCSFTHTWQLSCDVSWQLSVTAASGGAFDLLSPSLLPSMTWSCAVLFFIRYHVNQHIITVYVCLLFITSFAYLFPCLVFLTWQLVGCWDIMTCAHRNRGRGMDPPPLGLTSKHVDTMREFHAGNWNFWIT